MFLDAVPSGAVPYGLLRKHRLTLDSRGVPAVVDSLIDLLERLNASDSSGGAQNLPAPTPIGSQRLQTWRRYTIACLALLVLAFEFIYVPSLPFIVAGNIGKDPDSKTEVSRHAFDSYRNSDYVFMGIALTQAIGVAFVGYTRYSGIPIPSRQLDWIYACWTAVALSLFSGILGDFRLREVESIGALSTNIPLLDWPAGIQVFTVLVALPFAVFFGVGAFRRSKESL